MDTATLRALRLTRGEPVSFWSKGRRGKESEEAPAIAAATATSLAIVEFWAANRRTLVGMDLGQGRLTDVINGADFVSVVLLDGQPEDPSQPIGMLSSQGWSRLPVGDALLILPPPQATDPNRRLHRPRQPVEIVIGPFLVSGMVHVPPGAQAAGFLLRQNVRFVAVTRAAVRDSQLEGFEQRADVVLVNMRMIETIRDVGLDEREARSTVEATAPLA
jgi:hypothetical protein